MRTFIITLLIGTGIVLATSHYTHRDALDVSPRDVVTTAKAYTPHVSTSADGITFTPGTGASCTR